MKNFGIEVKWAIIYSLSLLIWMFLEKAVGLHDEHIGKHAIYTNLFAVVAIIIYVLALRDKKRNFFNGTMNWKQGFISGVVLSIIIAILSPLVQYAISTYITPEYFDTIIAYVVENGKMSQENAKAYFNLKSYMLQNAFGALCMGLITAAAVAFFVKSKNPSN